MSRLHSDYAINFLSTNWLVLMDAYSKYLWIHGVVSSSSKATMNKNSRIYCFHTLITDNASKFLSDEFQARYQEQGITHLNGAP